MLIGARPKSRVTTAPAAGAARPHLAAQNRPGGGRVRSERRCRMQVSAEARLWWCSRERDDVEAWFEKLSDLPPGGAPSLNRQSDAAENLKRQDVYLRDPGQAELGIKLRSSVR